MAQYLIGNWPMPTTAGPAKVATGTSIKTLLQVLASATKSFKIIEWGISFDGSAAATPILVELLQTDVAATVTAHVAAGIAKWDSHALMGGDPTTNLIQVGTAHTGYTASAEGSITATRPFDVQQIAPSGLYVKQFPLGKEPPVEIGKWARIRVTAPVSVNALAYMLIEV